LTPNTFSRDFQGIRPGWAWYFQYRGLRNGKWEITTGIYLQQSKSW